MPAMYVLFEEAGKFMAGRVLSEAESSAQVELDSGKRVKVKSANILIKFEKPQPADLVAAAQAQAHPIDSLSPVIGDAEVLAAREAVKAVHINADVARYIAQITAATRHHADLRLGVSPRGTLALARGSQGMAFLRGKGFVTPDIVKMMAGAILEHRLIVRPQAAAAGRTAREILNQILGELPPPV
jgi:MoxR-like ATPase